MQDPRCKHKYLDNLSNDVILLMMMKLFLIRLAMYQYNKYCNRHKSKPLWYLLYRIYRKILDPPLYCWSISIFNLFWPYLCNGSTELWKDTKKGIKNNVLFHKIPYIISKSYHQQGTDFENKVNLLTDLSSVNQPKREKGSWQKLISLSGYCSMVQKKPQTH